MPINGDTISEETDDGNMANRQAKMSVARALHPFFRMRRGDAEKCLSCDGKIADDGSEDFVEINENFFGFKQHKGCSGISDQPSGFSCSTCDKQINKNDLVVVECSCERYFHAACAHEFMVDRNRNIIRFGYYAGFIECPGCREIFYDLMHPLQRHYLLLFRDYGINTIKRGFFQTLYQSMYPESADRRTQYFRIAFNTNPKCWENEYDVDFIMGFSFRTFADFKIRDDIKFGVKPAPVFDTRWDGINFPVDFPDIQNNPYPNNHRDEDFLDFNRFHEPKPRLEKNNTFVDDIGQPVYDVKYITKNQSDLLGSPAKKTKTIQEITIEDDSSSETEIDDANDPEIDWGPASPSPPPSPPPAILESPLQETPYFEDNYPIPIPPTSPNDSDSRGPFYINYSNYVHDVEGDSDYDFSSD